MKIIQYLFVFLVRGYQYLISPWFPATCRHEPTCSSYTIEALKIWGPFKGLYLGVRRLMKCTPWGTSGYDPVPKKNKE